MLKVILESTPQVSKHPATTNGLKLSTRDRQERFNIAGFYPTRACLILCLHSNTVDKAEQDRTYLQGVLSKESPELTVSLAIATASGRVSRKRLYRLWGRETRT